MSMDETLASVSPVKQSKRLKLFGTALCPPKDDGRARMQALASCHQQGAVRQMLLYLQPAAGRRHAAEH